MLKKYIATLVAFFVFAGMVGCSTELALAEEFVTSPSPDTGGGTGTFPLPDQQDGGQPSGQTMPPPNVPSFDGDGRLQGQPFNGGRRPPVQDFDESGRGPQGQQFMGDKPEGSFRDFQNEWGDRDQGGSASDMQEKRREEQGKRMQQEQLRQVKRGMVSGVEQGLKQIMRMADRVSKKGIAVPTEVQTVVAELSVALEKVKGATEFTADVQDAIQTLQEKGHDLQELGQKLGMLEQMSQMAKQVEKELSRVDREVLKAKKTKVASQFPDVVTKIEEDLRAIRGKWEGVKSSVLGGSTDLDDVRDLMEDMFSDIGEVRKNLGLLRQLSSVSKVIRTAVKEIAKFEREVTRLQKTGMDVGALSASLAQAKETLAKIVALSKQSGFDPEDLFDLMQEMEHIKDEAMKEFERVTGNSHDDSLGASVIRAIEMRRLGF